MKVSEKGLSEEERVLVACQNCLGRRGGMRPIPKFAGFWTCDFCHVVSFEPER